MKNCPSILFLILFFKTTLSFSQVPFLIKNIHPSFVTSSYPQNPTDVNGTLFFSADNGTNGFELWKSDGTNPGTIMVKDLTPGTAGTPNMRDFISVNGNLFFSCKTGRELWVSNGTSTGTDTLITFSSFGTLKDDSYIELNNNLIFVTQNPSSGDLSLWKSGGTSSTTSLIKTFNNGGNSIHYSTFKKFNNNLYFVANDGIAGQEVWKTDGTTTGTVIVKDINSGSSDGTPWPDPPFFNEVNGFLFFQGNDGTTGDELWKTDGTNTGTTLVKDVRAGIGGSGITSPTPVGNKLFFKAFIGGMTSLWISDGTNSGTNKVIDLSLNDFMMAFDSSRLVFTQDNTTPTNYGKELWISDGTPAGTKILKDINPGNSSGIPTNHFKALVIDSLLFFNATDNINGLELWKSDGTDTGTILVKDMRPGSADGFINNSEFFFDANGILLFDAINRNSSSTTELWRSDGSDTGTYRYDIDTNGGGSIPKFCTLIDTTVFLVADDGFTGRELYAVYVDSIKKTIPVIVPSSILEAEFNPIIGVYPNPTVNRININLDNVFDENYIIQITSISGKKVYKKSHTQPKISIELYDLTDGIYFLTVISKNGLTETKKIIKHH